MHPDSEKLKDIFNRIDGNSPEDIQISRFKGGYSNLSYLVQISGGKKYVLRTAPSGVQIKSGHDMLREYTILQKIQPHFPKAPKVFLFSDDQSITGADFYIMEYIDGFILRSGLPEDQMPDSMKMAKMAASFIDTMVQIHRINVVEAGIGQIGNIEHFTDRQLSGWIKRYEAAATHEVEGIQVLMHWLQNNKIAGKGKPVLIHNDFKYDNIIYKVDDSVKTVLDWEMSTIGEPLIDLGCALAYWADPNDPDWFKDLQLNITTLPGNFSREEVLHQYSKITGTDPTTGVFLYTFGLLKLAVIAQQIYKRYITGQSTDSRFSGLNKAVQACVVMANQAIQLNRISNLFTA